MSDPESSPAIKPTKDGSTTLYSPKFNQHYHNPNGAVAESRHVFFDTPGLPEAIGRSKNLNIFETGFGTGLNLLLLLDYLNRSGHQTNVTVTSVEAFPVSADTAAQFDFGNNPALNQSAPILTDIFENLQPGFNRFEISNILALNLYVGFFDDLFSQSDIPSHFDFIFHDPFSPDVNSDLWTIEVFRTLALFSRPDAVLSTYCAASSARAAMAAAGWYVARAPGALGKREMTIASPSPGKLKPFKRVNEKRLVKRFEQGDFRN
jgi:tRNA U34 5-methylaminomethyl-2-thiouridine-forming methyltransferase MnmC